MEVKGACDYCGLPAPYYSKRGFYCDSHWKVAKAVDIGPVLSSQSYGSTRDYSKALADLKNRITIAINNSEKLLDT